MLAKGFGNRKKKWVQISLACRAEPMKMDFGMHQTFSKVYAPKYATHPDYRADKFLFESLLFQWHRLLL
jgi:hypothetical protein